MRCLSRSAGLCTDSIRFSGTSSSAWRKYRLLDQARFNLSDAPLVWIRVARDEMPAIQVDRPGLRARFREQRAAYAEAAGKALDALREFTSSRSLSQHPRTWRWAPGVSREVRLSAGARPTPRSCWARRRGPEATRIRWWSWPRRCSAAGPDRIGAGMRAGPLTWRRSGSHCSRQRISCVRAAWSRFRPQPGRGGRDAGIDAPERIRSMDSTRHGAGTAIGGFLLGRADSPAGWPRTGRIEAARIQLLRRPATTIHEAMPAWVQSDSPIGSAAFAADVARAVRQRTLRAGGPPMRSR